MGRLTDAVRDQVTSNAKKVPVPDWMGRYTVIVGVGFSVLVIVKLFLGGGDPAPVTSTRNQVAPTVEQPAPTEPAGPTTTGSTGTTSPGSAGDEWVVRDLSGVEVDVPAEALTVVTSAAVGILRGDVSDVPTLTAAPAVVPRAASPTVVSVTLTSAPQAPELSFTVTLDPGDGTPPVTQPVVVTNTSNRGWVWVPAGVGPSGG